MRRGTALLVLALVATAILFAQRLRQEVVVLSHAPMEVMSVFPTEIQPGQYQQVDQRRLETLSEQGWELVSVTPFIYRNEEHNNGEMRGPRPVVTQTYPAYFFRRAKLTR